MKINIEITENGLRILDHDMRYDDLADPVKMVNVCACLCDLGSKLLKSAIQNMEVNANNAFNYEGQPLDEATKRKIFDEVEKGSYAIMQIMHQNLFTNLSPNERINRINKRK